MSIAQLILLANWLLQFNFKERVLRFWANKDALVYSAIFWICMIGFLHTEDMNEGVNVTRTMLPIFLVPLFLASSKPLSKKEFHFYLGIFIATVVFVTLLGMLASLGIMFEKETNPRHLSMFISSIRLSLMMDIAIAMLIYYALGMENIKHKLLMMIPVVWLLYFLTKLESLTGIVILMVFALATGIYFMIKDKKKIRRFVSIAVVVLIPLTGLFILNYEFKSIKFKTDIKWDDLEKKTANGNYYWHDQTPHTYENGTFVGTYLCLDEIREEWAKRSDRAFDDKSTNVRPVLIRYLASRGLRKDSAGISQLTDQEVKDIENGVTNYLFPVKRGLVSRWYDIKWQFGIYLNGGNPNGHSLTQRFEYWKNAYHVYRDNPVFGVGVGDAETALEDQYLKDDSQMTDEWQLMAHNQYLTFGAQIGTVGLLAILTCFGLLIRTGFRKNATMFLYFMLAMCVSMLFEDSLLTQAGCTLFGAIGGFMLFGREEPI
ncbi:MAG: O-antigen ligase family protein [Flavobacteriales bacterium]|nr:O-antigen ligase family protein [Flavobacteriales bacterium]